MKTKAFAFLAVMLMASVATTAPRTRKYAATDTGGGSETGLAGDAVAGGATSDSINMGEQFWGSTLTWQATITPGTTTSVVVTCEESIDDSVWVKVPGCSSAVAATCSVLRNACRTAGALPCQESW